MLKRTLDRVVVVGAGGTGSWLLAPLARFLAAENFKGTLAIYDGDSYSDKNMLRQEFDRAHLHLNKATVWGRKLRFQYLDLKIEDHPSYVSDENVNAVVTEDSLVMLCVDNHGARARVTRQACALDDVCVLHAGNDIIDGNVHTFLRADGKALTRNVIEDHPEIARAEETGRGDPTKACDNVQSESAPQLLVANFWSAAMLFATFHKLWILQEPAGKRRHLEIDQEVNWDSLRLKTLPFPVQPCSL